MVTQKDVIRVTKWVTLSPLASFLEESMEDARNRGEVSGINPSRNFQEVVDLTKQINLEVNSDDVQELLDFHNQELTIDKLIEMHEQEQDIEEPESL
ncbi:hypothetical protein TNCV_3216791 [Trichonephila clavipes]|nr:hypothetical protein TNCV_3216791 [Trichonephila clavipes]